MSVWQCYTRAMSFAKVRRESREKVARAIHRSEGVKGLRASGRLSLVRAIQEHCATDPAAPRRVVQALFDAATDTEHPRCIEAARILLDRLDGPVRQQVGLSWDRAREGITLHLSGGSSPPRNVSPPPPPEPPPGDREQH